MAEVAPAAAPAKAPKKKAASRTKKSGPSVGDLIIKAVSSSKERNGVSLSALKKDMQAAGYDVEKNNHRVKIAVRNLVAKDILVQTKGTGASGSFKLNRKQTEAKKAAPKKAAVRKPTAAKKAKKPAVKKAKKPPAAAKKVTKSPKKAKKPATPKMSAKSAKKTKTAKLKAKKAAPTKK